MIPCNFGASAFLGKVKFECSCFLQGGRKQKMRPKLYTNSAVLRRVVFKRDVLSTKLGIVNHQGLATQTLWKYLRTINCLPYEHSKHTVACETSPAPLPLEGSLVPPFTWDQGQSVTRDGEDVLSDVLWSPGESCSLDDFLCARGHRQHTDAQPNLPVERGEASNMACLDQLQEGSL